MEASNPVETYFISFREWPPTRHIVRVEFSIRAGSRHEARTIAEKRAEELKELFTRLRLGYRYDGID